MTPNELEAALEAVLGETEEEGGMNDYYEQYTGLNGFYHILFGTGPDVTNLVRDKVDGNYETGVTVPGVGFFKLVETTEENFDTYEKSWDNFGVFEHNGETFRKQGYLDSWNGGVWDGTLQKVQAVEVKVREWQEV